MKQPARSSRRQPSRRTASTPESSQNTRSSPRARKRSAVRYTEVNSDDEIYQSDDNDNEEEDDEPEETRPSRRGTKRSAATAAAQGRRSSPRRRVAARRQETSDEESESSISGPSEGESESEEEESDHEHSDGDHSASSEGSDEYVASARASTKRRKRSAAASGSAQKKSKAGAKKTGGDLYYPDLSKWPPIVDLRDITKVSKKILEVCAEADTEGLFTAPVVEAFPEVADSYLSVVSEPMDFRTIEEERLPAYQDMHELQEDLIKVFRNCCVFNGEGTDYYHYAVNIWSGLNNIFKEACEEFDIAVPR